MFDKSNACDRFIEHNNVRLAMKKEVIKNLRQIFCSSFYTSCTFLFVELTWKLKEVRLNERENTNC